MCGSSRTSVQVPGAPPSKSGENDASRRGGRKRWISATTKSFVRSFGVRASMRTSSFARSTSRARRTSFGGRPRSQSSGESSAHRPSSSTTRCSGETIVSIGSSERSVLEARESSQSGDCREPCPSRSEHDDDGTECAGRDDDGRGSRLRDLARQHLEVERDHSGLDVSTVHAPHGLRRGRRPLGRSDGSGGRAHDRRPGHGEVLRPDGFPSDSASRS
ncbi:MAG: hypothetical protein QOD06_1940 [Candidatus Binatota bacterium]|nr:hypothetical protein [Candidatus Binatota bacterium]